MMSQNDKDTQLPEADFHGAAIISEDGKETPITEEMVQQACEKMKSDESDDTQ